MTEAASHETVPHCPACGSAPPTFRLIDGITCGCGNYTYGDPHPQNAVRTESRGGSQREFAHVAAPRQAPVSIEPKRLKRLESYLYFQVDGPEGKYWVQARSAREAEGLYKKYLKVSLLGASWHTGTGTKQKPSEGFIGWRQGQLDFQRR